METFWRFIGVIAFMLAVAISAFTIDTVGVSCGIHGEVTDDWMRMHLKKQKIQGLCDNLPRDKRGNLTKEARELLEKELYQPYS